MTVRKRSVAAGLAPASARRAGARSSGGITQAMQDRLRREAGLAAVAEFEAEHGAFTSRELADAERRVRAVFARADRATQRNERTS